jgi:hypothetical protein
MAIILRGDSRLRIPKRKMLATFTQKNLQLCRAPLFQIS